MNFPQPDIFDPANARDLCLASAASYQSRAAAEQISLWSGATDTRVLITVRDNDLIVAFRGTQDLRNWVTDLDCEFVRLGGARVHRGFHQALHSVWDDLERVIASQARARLWLTGHSLGGALAMLFAWRCERWVDGLYTFGQPRVGDAHFAESYGYGGLKFRTFRVVHADDIVPRVPWLLGRYRHAGHEVFCPSPSSFQLDRPWFTRLPSDLRGLADELHRGRLALLDHHHIKGYLALFPGRSAATSVSLS